MQATTPIAAATPQPTQSPIQPRSTARKEPLGGIDRTLADMLGGVDLRLILGMLMPMLLVIGLIVSLAQSPSYWLVGLALVSILCCLGLVLTKLLALLEDPDETA